MLDERVTGLRRRLRYWLHTGRLPILRLTSIGETRLAEERILYMLVAESR